MTWGVPKLNNVEIIFSYTAIEGVSCPVCDENVFAYEVHNGVDKFHCVCSAVLEARWDTLSEREAFIKKYERGSDDSD